MKKSSLFSLIVYILYTLLGGGYFVYAQITLRSNQNGELGLEALGIAILMVLAIVFGAIGLLGLILKAIHIKTDWGFFGFLCILVDLVFIIAWIGMLFSNGNVEQMTLTDILPVIPFVLVSVVSIVTNAVSLKK